MPGEGDLRAIEGTKVTIHATANREIKEAEIDLDCDEKYKIEMEPVGQTATKLFTLRMDQAPRTNPGTTRINFASPIIGAARITSPSGITST